MTNCSANVGGNVEKKKQKKTTALETGREIKI